MTDLIGLTQLKVVGGLADVGQCLDTLDGLRL